MVSKKISKKNNSLCNEDTQNEQIDNNDEGNPQGWIKAYLLQLLFVKINISSKQPAGLNVHNLQRSWGDENVWWGQPAGLN